jgi:hypothetical protein
MILHAVSGTPVTPAAGVFMYDTYIIKTRKGPAGIVVRNGRGFRYFAATRDFTHLEDHLFGSSKDAEAAARRHKGGVKEAPNGVAQGYLAGQRSI